MDETMTEFDILLGSVLASQDLSAVTGRHGKLRDLLVSDLREHVRVAALKVVGDRRDGRLRIEYDEDGSNALLMLHAALNAFDPKDPIARRRAERIEWHRAHAAAGKR